MPLINPYIFREYDIRGKVVEDFPEHVVIKLAKAFGTFVKGNRNPPYYQGNADFKLVGINTVSYKILHVSKLPY